MTQLIYRGSYLSAHTLLNLSNKFGKDEKYEAFRAFDRSVFRNEFNKSNKTGAQMLDSIYHMTIDLFNLR